MCYSCLVSGWRRLLVIGQMMSIFLRLLPDVRASPADTTNTLKSNDVVNNPLKTQWGALSHLASLHAPRFSSAASRPPTPSCRVISLGLMSFGKHGVKSNNIPPVAPPAAPFPPPPYVDHHFITCGPQAPQVDRCRAHFVTSRPPQVRGTGVVTHNYRCFPP